MTHDPDRSPVFSILCDAGCVRMFAGFCPEQGRWLCQDCLECANQPENVERR